MVVIYRERNCAENYSKFCVQNGQICETALGRPKCIDWTQFRAGYGALGHFTFWISLFAESFRSVQRLI